MSAASRELPAEWSPQWGVMLTWPHAKMDWENIVAVEEVYLQLVAAIAAAEKILIVCYDAKHQQQIKHKIQSTSQLAQCYFVNAASNDVWTRDHGPISIKQNGQRLLLNFEFNGWGNKYPAALDNAINQQVFTQQFKQKIEHIDFVLEGGSIDNDGNGTLLTTQRCLFNSQRNPTYSASQIKNLLKDKLGIQKILFLTYGALLGDDTDSHIDTLVRFCNSQTLMHVSCDKTDNKHYSELHKMQQELQHFKNSKGQHYQLIAVPLPSAIYHQGKRLPATYLNFLIINHAVLLPIYHDKKDAEVITIFESVFTHHKIIPINCLAIIQQFGSLHCLTMQLAE